MKKTIGIIITGALLMLSACNAEAAAPADENNQEATETAAVTVSSDMTETLKATEAPETDERTLKEFKTDLSGMSLEYPMELLTDENNELYKTAYLMEYQLIHHSNIYYSEEVSYDDWVEIDGIKYMPTGYTYDSWEKEFKKYFTDDFASKAVIIGNSIVKNYNGELMLIGGDGLFGHDVNYATGGKYTIVSKTDDKIVLKLTQSCSLEKLVDEADFEPDDNFPEYRWEAEYGDITLVLTENGWRAEWLPYFIG